MARSGAVFGRPPVSSIPAVKITRWRPAAWWRLTDPTHAPGDLGRYGEVLTWAGYGVRRWVG